MHTNNGLNYMKNKQKKKNNIIKIKQINKKNNTKNIFCPRSAYAA